MRPALYADIGGPEDLDQANQVFALTHTTAGTDGEWARQAVSALADG